MKSHQIKDLEICSKEMITIKSNSLFHFRIATGISAPVPIQFFPIFQEIGFKD